MIFVKDFLNSFRGRGFLNKIYNKNSDATKKIIPKRTAGKSYEWIAYGDQEPHCWAPWRVLKVDIFARTLSCEGFFEKLPEFEWPTAKEFHKEEGMWNHPVMQHLRGSLDTGEELPFCTFCKKNDKRHPDTVESKKTASLKSMGIFQSIYDEIADFEFQGGLAEIKGQLTDFEIQSSKKSSVVFRPFKRNLAQYRRSVRMGGFWNAGSVLQLGIGAGAISPFLAEGNKSLVIVDSKLGRINNVTDIMNALKFNNFSCSNISDIGDLCELNERFDATWIDGEWLSQYGRSNVLNAVCGVLKPGAIIYVTGAKSLGYLVKKAINAKSTQELEAIIDLIGKGPMHDGHDSYLNADRLLAILKPFGLDLDRSRPALSRYIGSSRFRDAPIWNNLSQLSNLLRDEKFRTNANNNPKELDGLVECVSFTAFTKPEQKFEIINQKSQTLLKFEC